MSTVAELSPRETWLASRRLSIGASESPAILGQGYSGENALTIWISKTAEEPPPADDDNERFEWGHLLQPAILQGFARRTGMVVRDLGEFTIQRHPEMSWLSATLDGMADDPEGPAVVECKNVDAFARGDWKGDEPPLRHNIQVQHQMLVCGVGIAYVVGLIGGNRLAYKRVLRNDRFIDAMLPHLKRFWQYVETRTPPPIDGSAASSAALKRMFPDDDGTSIILPDASADFAELAAIKEVEKALKARRLDVENRVKAAMGPHTEALLPDGSRFSWKTQQRAAYTVAAGSSRVFRQHTPKVKVESDASRIGLATVALLRIGATLVDESDSGSRYFELAGGLVVRVANHEANRVTANWIARKEVAEVRVDSDDWRNQLESITGPIESED